MAVIKQKKKSEDVVNVELNNELQFEKTAILRKHIEIRMLEEMGLNDKEMKIDEEMYDLTNKLEETTAKLARLSREAEEKNIVVSSNKYMIRLKEKKNGLSKTVEEKKKKIALLKSSGQTSEWMINRTMDITRKEISEKDARIEAISQQVEDVSTKNGSFLMNESLTKSLRKSISFNYAETLLKMKGKVKAARPPEKPSSLGKDSLG